MWILDSWHTKSKPYVNNLSKSKLDDNVSMFVGMDLHKNYLQIAVMNEKGEVLENSRINNSLKLLVKFFDNLNDQKTRIVMESSCVWYNIYRYLSEEKRFNVVLSKKEISVGSKSCSP
jgi:Transposase